MSLKLLLLASAFVSACAVDPGGLPGDLGNGVADANLPGDAFIDECPGDPEKTEPGLCGCGMADTDRDGDAEPDCIDDCPDDPAKTAGGVCGCGRPDVDTDSDGSFACNDCDDGNATRAPTLPELCDGVDNDCDSSIDEDACETGCADGTREGFSEEDAYPTIAACDSAWSLPGVLGDGVPSCSREAGNDGVRPDGIGCDIDDSCAEGWHVCAAVDEIAAAGASCGDLGGASPFFYTTSISGPGDNRCAESGSNNAFGCGNATTGPIDADSCEPLNMVLGFPCRVAQPTSVWSCSAATANTEADFVTKAGPTEGGVLCCRD